jgi:hypothetical protein
LGRPSGAVSTRNRKSLFRSRVYFGNDHLLRRHDYRVDVAGGFPAVQYVYDIVEVDGIKLPSKRRAYRADAQHKAIPDQLMVAIDLSDITFD